MTILDSIIFFIMMLLLIFSITMKCGDERTTYDILSLDDPLPAIGMIIDGFLSLMNRDRREYVFDRGVRSEHH